METQKSFISHHVWFRFLPIRSRLIIRPSRDANADLWRVIETLHVHPPPDPHAPLLPVLLKVTLPPALVLHVNRAAQESPRIKVNPLDNRVFDIRPSARGPERGAGNDVMTTAEHVPAVRGPPGLTPGVHGQV